MLAALVAAFFTVLEVGADIMLAIGGAIAFVITQVDYFTDVLSKAIGEVTRFFNMLLKISGLTDGVKSLASSFGETRMGQEMGHIADEWNPFKADSLVGARIRESVGAGRAERAQALNARNTYSGARGLTQMAMAGGYGQLTSPVAWATAGQQDLARGRMGATGQVAAPASPNVFNINVNGAEKSNEEVGKEIGKQVARDLQGRKQ